MMAHCQKKKNIFHDNAVAKFHAKRALNSNQERQL